MNANDNVRIDVTGGPHITLAWREGMNVRAALELAYEEQRAGQPFTYALQYYGRGLGYLVMMINENYDSFDVRYEPDFYWDMLVNGSPSETGIDHTLLRPGDVVTFRYEIRQAEARVSPLTQIKHERRQRGGT